MPGVLHDDSNDQSSLKRSQQSTSCWGKTSNMIGRGWYYFTGIFCAVIIVVHDDQVWDGSLTMSQFHTFQTIFVKKFITPWQWSPQFWVTASLIEASLAPIGMFNLHLQSFLQLHLSPSLFFHHHHSFYDATIGHRLADRSFTHTITSEVNSGFGRLA